MKTNTTLSLIIFAMSLATSCDSPRSQRALTGQSSSSVLTNNTNSNPINLDNSSNSSNGTTNTTGTSNTTSTTPSTPSDTSHCKISTDGTSNFESTSSHLGEYTLCQSSTDKDSFYFQLKIPPVNSRGDVSICLIPTTSTGNTSIYVGNPMCGLFKSSKELRKITFIKYAQYSNANINGVIFFKDLSWIYPVFYLKDNYGSYRPMYNIGINTLDAYKTCMSMLSEIGNSVDCAYFKSLGQYVYKQF